MKPAWTPQAVAARYVLGNATGDELVGFANELLAQGIYSHALGELATLRYPMSTSQVPVSWIDADRLFKRALNDLGVPLPSEEVAAIELIKHNIWEVVEGRCTPQDGLNQLVDEWWFLQWDAEDPVGDVGELLSCCWGFQDFNTLENAESMDALNLRVLHLADQWTLKHCSAMIDPAWLRWNDSTVSKLAQAIGDDRAFDRLPILADALLDAGCDNADILDHCRSPGPHVRGCWVVDLILDRK